MQKCLGIGGRRRNKSPKPPGKAGSPMPKSPVSGGSKAGSPGLSDDGVSVNGIKSISSLY